MEWLLGLGWPNSGQWLIVLLCVTSLALIIAFAIGMKWGAYWLQAYMSGADVSMKSLIVMTFLRIDHRLIVTPKIMAHQAGLDTARQSAMSTSRLQAHYLAGGDVMNVVKAIIAAHRAGMDLDFDRAAAIDLAGRDVLLAVQTSVFPKVIRCPDGNNGKHTLSAIAKDGVELLVGARVTVRTNLAQLIGGATEETIVARVGQAIVTAIGSSAGHMEVLEMPSRISKSAMANGLDANTAFSIVSIDIADIDVGKNIGAILQRDQADADSRIARAKAEIQRAEAVALKQVMTAKIAENKSHFVLAQAKIPVALADAFRTGSLRSKQPAINSPRRRIGPGPGETPAKLSPRPEPTDSSSRDSAKSDPNRDKRS